MREKNIYLFSCFLYHPLLLDIPIENSNPFKFKYFIKQSLSKKDKKCQVYKKYAISQQIKVLKNQKLKYIDTYLTFVIIK